MPRQPKRRMKIAIQSPDGWRIEWGATPDVLAKPGVDAMWTTIANEAASFITKRYGELKALTPTETPQ